MMGTTYLFTIPVKYAHLPHPLGAGPTDLIEVEADNEHDARLMMNQTLGNGTWCSVHIEAELEPAVIRAYYPGKRITYTDPLKQV
jgi:hypothetical protein